MCAEAASGHGPPLYAHLLRFSDMKDIPTCHTSMPLDDDVDNPGMRHPAKAQKDGFYKTKEDRKREVEYSALKAER
jgi:hypothetical protein